MTPESWLKLAEILVSAGGVIAAGVLASMAIHEYRSSIEERRRALRWQQAQMARDVIAAIRQNKFSASALKMLDWEKIKYTKNESGETTLAFTKQERREMLRVDDTNFEKKSEADAEFVRDCFDRLLEDLCLVYRFLINDLILQEDIKPFFSHYMKLASSEEEAEILDRFAKKYGNEDFTEFRELISGKTKDGA